VTRLVDAVTPNGSDDEDDRDLDDRDYERELFCWREEHLLDTVARRMRSAIDDDTDQFEVMIDVQDHILAAARAHIDRVIFDAFARAVDDCDDDALKPVLTALFRLYALYNIEQDRGWFFEHGRMTGPRAKSLTRTVNRLCAELREHADLLVDAFAIPDEVLRAPIGLKAQRR
jgi:acyl-CoA oxidase